MKLKKALAIGMVAALAVSLVACGGTKITELTLDSEKTLNKGDTYQFAISYKAQNETDIEKINEAAKDYVLEWASSNELVATVDENGTVTAIDVGDAVITVSVKNHDKLTAACNITVENRVTGVNVAKSLDLEVGGETGEINATVNPEDAIGYEIRYESSDEKIATVDEKGIVTAVSEGKCTVKTIVVATTATGEVEDEKEVVDSEAVSEAASSGSEANSTDSKANSETSPESEATSSESEAASSESVNSEAEDAENAENEGIVLASAETEVVVKAAKEVKPETTKPTANKVNTTGSTTTTSTTTTPVTNNNTPEPAAPVATPVPAAPVNPAPAPVPAPDPAPAPAPDPEPAPAPDPEPAPAPDNSSDGSEIVYGPGAGVGKDNDVTIGGGGTTEGNMGEGTLDPD